MWKFHIINIRRNTTGSAPFVFWRLVLSDTPVITARLSCSNNRYQSLFVAKEWIALIPDFITTF